MVDAIARSLDEYVKLAVQLSGVSAAATQSHRYRLQRLRANQQRWMLRSPLTDTERFTFFLEDAYRKMWQQ